MTGYTKLCDELDEWRSGKRRIVWRVRWFKSKTEWFESDLRTKREALRHMRHLRAERRTGAIKLYRVTVRRKGAK